MGEISLPARAKINLTLDVLGKRADGYHEVEMIMQSLELHDFITIKDEGQEIIITSNRPEVPLDRDNLAYKAATKFLNYNDLDTGLKIHIEKNIPVAAGLAGGSTDAAAVLIGLNQLLDTGLSLGELMKIGSEIGSDIPFCILGGTALARGRGEILKPLPPLPETWLVLIKPDFGVSTAEVYKNYKAHKVYNHPDTKGAIGALKKKDLDAVIAKMANVLESVTFEMHPKLKILKEKMLDAGTLSSMMSGSGPTLFGFTKGYREAMEAARKLESEGLDIFVTKTYNPRTRNYKEVAGIR